MGTKHFHWKLTIGVAYFAALATIGLATSAAAQTISASSVSGVRCGSVWFNVTLDPQGKSIAGTQNDISYSTANIPIATCQKDTNLTDKDLSWSYPATGKVRGLILSTSDSSAILSPKVVYRCRVDIPATATLGTYTLTVSNAKGTDPLGNSKTLTGQNGQITITSGGC
jgi:hypothetical protein